MLFISAALPPLPPIPLHTTSFWFFLSFSWALVCLASTQWFPLVLWDFLLAVLFLNFKSLEPHPCWLTFHVVGMLWFMYDINQLSLPTPFYSVLMSISVFIALSTVFHFINSPDNSPFSHAVLPVLSFSFSAIYPFMKVSFSPDVIPSGWLLKTPVN